jgi:diphthine-ammonia ligase
MKNIGCSWSGGKDSCLALMKAVALGYKPTVLLTMLNENGKISRSHGLSLELLQQQAKALDLPLITIPSTWERYEERFIETLQQLATQYSIEAMVFGDIDIDIERHRQWEEKVCAAAKIEALLPLWQRSRKELALEIIDSKISSIIVSCNPTLGEGFLGKVYDKEFINELANTDIDECGENGEFHSIVVNCPLFKNEIIFPKYAKKTIGNYCFLDWES